MIESSAQAATESISNGSIPTVAVALANAGAVATSAEGEQDISTNADGRIVDNRKRIVVIEKFDPEPDNDVKYFYRRSKKKLDALEQAEALAAMENNDDMSLTQMKYWEKCKQEYDDYKAQYDSALTDQAVAPDMIDNDKADTIVLHYTACGQDGDSSTEPNGLGSLYTLSYYPGSNNPQSSHFVILRNGRIIWLFDFDKRTQTQANLRPAVDNCHSYVILDRQNHRSANDFAYSIECISGDEQHGTLRMAQIYAAAHTVNHIRREVKKEYDIDININRVWEDWPAYAPITTVIEEDSRYFKKIYGNLLGHIETGNSICPGMFFPWQSILKELGVHPDMGEDHEYIHLEKRYKAIMNEQYAAYETYLENRKNLIDENPYITGEEIDEQLEPVNQPAYLDATNPLDDVEYVIWNRPKEDIFDTDKYDVREERLAWLEEHNYPATKYKLAFTDEDLSNANIYPTWETTRQNMLAYGMISDALVEEDA